MLTDTFNRVHDYLRISITDKCNLRCSYCMPYDLPHGHFAEAQRMRAEEIFAIAKTFVDLGIKKIRITGGEPLARKEFRKIIQLLSELPAEIALSSNGVLINDFIDDLNLAGIRSVNISLDSLDPQKFLNITKRNAQEKVLSNIRLLIEHNFVVKMNVVVMKGVNENEIPDFIELTRDMPLQVRFIEYMPFLGNGWNKNAVFSSDDILAVVTACYEIEKLADENHATAKKYRAMGHKGVFGIIPTMSEPFCGDCNRLRLTSDGKIKNCLFGKEELDLLSALRNGLPIEDLIIKSVKNKYAVRGGQFEDDYKLINADLLVNRSMVGIGG
ncbi:GTP 3',8-cyclase MoaA [Ignavibacteria bacterium]|nr:GTP 3',8-cyclase MoaA [Bacteroidota bacterium]MCZ2133350.1 GTP 3',8-cyclase MoaA [Bacteroidota bacterium]